MAIRSSGICDPEHSPDCLGTFGLMLASLQCPASAKYTLGRSSIPSASRVCYSCRTSLASRVTPMDTMIRSSLTTASRLYPWTYPCLDFMTRLSGSVMFTFTSSVGACSATSKMNQARPPRQPFPYRRRHQASLHSVTGHQIIRHPVHPLISSYSPV